MTVPINHNNMTPSASNSSVVAILGAVGSLITMIAIAVITFVLIARLRSKVNRWAQDKYNLGILISLHNNMILCSQKQPYTSEWKHSIWWNITSYYHADMIIKGVATSAGSTINNNPQLLPLCNLACSTSLHNHSHLIRHVTVPTNYTTQHPPGLQNN